MRQFFILLFLIPLLSSGQVNDQFMDGDFTANPTWTGDTTQWKIVNGQLNSNGAAVTGTVLNLSTPSVLASNCQWEFFANPKLATSSGNYMDVFLISDSANLKGNNSGYFVRIGGSLDEVSLFLKQGNVITKIIDGTDKIIASSSNNPTTVRVIRNDSNVWKLEVDVTGAGSSFILQGTVTDSSIISSAYFGVLVKYSATNAQKYFFDDFNVSTIVIDTIAPTIDSLYVISANQINVHFNESIDSSFALALGNYTVNMGIGNPSTAILDSTNPSIVHLTFSVAFTHSVSNSLTVTNVKDQSNNVNPSSSKNFIYYAPHVPEFGDVVINEIMADPDPPIALPNAEYIELYNTSSFAMNVNNWKLIVGTTTRILPDITLFPNQFLVLTSTTDTADFEKSIAIAGIASFPSLTNTGQTITLKTSTGAIIHSVSYSDKWYQDNDKQEGGWALEQIDPTNPCAGITNWKASTDASGGTPGRKNAVNASNPDNSPPQLVRAAVLAKDTIQLYFSESLNRSTTLNPLVYSIDKGIGTPLSIYPLEPDFKSVILVLPTPLQPHVIYTITVNNILIDCKGNSIDNANTVRVALPDTVSATDIIINEVLAYPTDNGVDFIEIYNRSNKVIDLKNLTLSAFDSLTQTFTSSYPIATEGNLIFPQDYLVLSSNSEAVKKCYHTLNPSGFADMSTLPSMNIAGGAIALRTKGGELIDQFRYTEEMHFPLLNTTKGVSLERIDFNRATDDKTNWHSAAETVGFATPAYRNSQYGENENEKDVSISPELFSPDNDGYNDIANINYTFDAPGYVGNITIFDSKGRIEKYLVKNELLGTSGTYSWDGINENREKSHIGIYIIYFEAFSADGKVKHYKKTCVLGGKL